jgi:hypothetical protein
VPADTPSSLADRPSTRSRKQGPAFGRSASALAQANRASGWAPILAAVAIDLADLAMIGPTGLVFGLFVGGLLTTTVARASGARWRRALGLGLLGGIYCALPFDAIPVATMLTLVHVALTRMHAPAGQLREAEPEGEVIDTTAKVTQLA